MNRQTLIHYQWINPKTEGFLNAFFSISCHAHQDKIGRVANSI
uniref:Uncharacterized protein n=1 Tax=Rhizophora mucronata TaxID=61149 RepID=A0A2P2J1Z3_RHIMU